jgi:hypothetical protein
MKNKSDYQSVARYAPGRVLGALILAAALLGTKPDQAQAQATGYSFEVIAFLGDPAPGGSGFTNDFEPSAINNRGGMAFTADLTDSGQEGAFLVQHERVSQLMRFGQPAPGGGTFSDTELGNIGLNDEGDLAVGFSLEPLQFDPFVNGGIYRYSHRTHALTAAVIPGTAGPGGGTFLGVDFGVSLNNQGTLAFTGFVGSPDAPTRGVYVADREDHIRTVAGNGTPGPNGGTFTRAGNPRLNNRGDVVFNGHISTVTEDVQSVYVRQAGSGKIVTIANAGDAAPGGEVLVETTSPRINDRGDVAFLGYFSYDPTTVFNETGLFLHRRGGLIRIAGPGDPMPWGGNVTFISAVDWNVGLNNHGELAFSTGLDNGDEGLYLFSHGSIRLVAKTGTVIRHAGTIFSLETDNPVEPGTPPEPLGWPTSGAQMNDRGQIFFGCMLTDGRAALVVATPTLR